MLYVILAIFFGGFVLEQLIPGWLLYLTKEI